MSTDLLHPDAELDRHARSVWRAAAGELPWPGVLDGLCAGLQARSLVLLTVATADGRQRALHQGGQPLDDAALQALFGRRTDTRNPHQPWPGATWPGPAAWRQLGADLPCGAGTGLGLRPTRSTTRASQLAPVLAAGLCSSVAIVWSPGAAAAGPPGPAWLDRLARHLHAALQAWHRLQGVQAHALLGQALLGAAAQPAWLLQPDGAVLQANAAGRRAEAAGSLLRNPAAALRPADAAWRPSANVLRPADAALWPAWDAALANAAAAADGQRVLLPLAAATQRGPAPQLVLRRLLQPAVASGNAPPAAAPVLLALLFDPDAVLPLHPPMLAAVFGFTPAEARVAACMAEGCTAPEIATRLAVAPSTVRSHLRQVLAKLGTPRKLDAVRLLCQGGWLWRDGSGGQDTA